MKLVFAICLAMIAAIIMVGCSQEQDLYTEGQGQAERDLAKGEFRIAFPDDTNMPTFGQYTELLHKRYGIDWCGYSLPANPRAAKAWVRGYNEVALPKIEQELGAQILKQTMADAQKLHDTAIAKPPVSK
jgi:hypothetical protein